MEKNEILANLMACEARLQKIREEEAELRKSIAEEWRNINNKLDSLQGQERSSGFKILQTFSTNLIPTSITTLEMLKKALTPTEKEILGY